MHLIDFFKNELNYTCEVCNKNTQKMTPKKEFKYCQECRKIICTSCSKNHEHKKKLILVSKMSIQQNTLYNTNNVTTDASPENNNQLETNAQNNDNKDNEKEILSKDYIPKEEEIQTIVDKNLEIKRKIRSLRLLIKINNILINTYEKYPDNYINNKNISNISNQLNSIINDAESTLDESVSEKKFKISQKILLDTFNSKLNTNFNGYETKIDLSNRLILSNTELGILSLLKLSNLEELNLKNNDIENIDALQNLNAPNLRILDISSNKIKDLSSLRSISFNLNKLEKINLSNNKITDIKILNNEDLFPEVQEINLENNYINYNSSGNKIIISKYTVENRQQTFLKNFNKKFKTSLTINAGKIKLENYSLGDEGLKMLCKIQFTNLKELNLCNNNISDISCIYKLLNNNTTSIEKINLKNNKIENINVFNGLNLPQLKELDLRLNNIDQSDEINNDIIGSLEEKNILLLN